MNFVSNKPLREAFEKSSFSARELADILGYRRTLDGRDVPDPSQVKRKLGLAYSTSRGKRWPPQRYLTEETALKFGNLLGLDPHELDL